METTKNSVFKYPLVNNLKNDFMTWAQACISENTAFMKTVEMSQ